MKYSLMKPLLPDSDAVKTYLDEIDVSRFYSNGGPLAKRLGNRLASILGLEESHVACLCNSTLGLVSCIRMMAPSNKKYCVIPSWTFPAVPAAVISAGFVPYFIDVDKEAGCITPEIVRQSLPNLDNVAAVVVVSNAGRALDIGAWEQFRQASGISVVVDAAAAFDTIARGFISPSAEIPISVSLHATKVFGIGEGGIVICRDPEKIKTIKYLGNFGFTPERDVILPGINAKLSEYGAAVGLAAADQWPYKREKWASVTLEYLSQLQRRGLRAFLTEDYNISTCSVILDERRGLGLPPVIDQLRERGIEARRYWQTGCHVKSAYQAFPVSDMSNTEYLADTVLTLPFHVDMSPEDIDKILSELVGALQRP